MCLWLKASKQADQAVRSDHAKPKAAIVVLPAYPLQCLCLRARARAFFFLSRHSVLYECACVESPTLTWLCWLLSCIWGVGACV